MSDADQKRAAIAALEAQFGPDDPRVADALEDFALWYADNRIYSGAAPYFRRSLAIREKQLGTSLAVADALERWARCAQRKHNNEAEDLFRRSLAVRESIMGRTSLDLVPRFDALAEQYLRDFRIAEAVSCLKRSLEIVERHRPVSAEMARRLLDVGKVLLSFLEPDEAEPLLRRALAVRMDLNTPADADLADTLDALIQALTALNRLDDIGPLLSRSLKTKAALFADDPLKLRETFEAAIAPFARHGRAEDLASLLQGGGAGTWPRNVRLLFRFAQELRRQDREADMTEAIRLGIETLEKILDLGEDERFAALRELWPESVDDDFIRQMSRAPDLRDDRLPDALGRIAAACTTAVAHRDISSGEEFVEIESIDNEEFDEGGRE